MNEMSAPELKLMPKIIKAGELLDYKKTRDTLSQAETTLAQARVEAEEIKKSAYQDGFEAGIEASHDEVGALIIKLKNDYANKIQDLNEDIPDIIGEICAYLVGMELTDTPAYDAFVHFLKLMVYKALSDYSSQSNLVVRAGDEFSKTIKNYLCEQMGEDWVERNVNIKADKNLDYFAFSIEHDRGVLHFDGKEKLIDLLTAAFFDPQQQLQTAQTENVKAENPAEIPVLDRTKETHVGDLRRSQNQTYEQQINEQQINERQINETTQALPITDVGKDLNQKIDVTVEAGAVYDPEVNDASQ